MTMREYEERFRSPPPSLHQISSGSGDVTTADSGFDTSGLLRLLSVSSLQRRFQTISDFFAEGDVWATLKFEELYGRSHAGADRVNRSGRQSCSSNVVPRRLSTNCLTISRCNFLCDAMGDGK